MKMSTFEMLVSYLTFAALQSADGPIVVAAIDFGTTYSGWAFSFKHEFESDPTKISSKHWRGGQLISHKGPTCVLIKPDGKTLDSFAFDAETKYADLSANGEHTKWYYFRRFKMMLYDKMVSMSRYFNRIVAKIQGFFSRNTFTLPLYMFHKHIVRLHLQSFSKLVNYLNFVFM